MAIRVGGGVSTLKGFGRYENLPSEYSGRPSVRNRFSWEAGISFQTGLQNDFFLQSECNINMLGASIDGVYKESGNKRTKINALDIFGLQLNIHFGKKIALSDNFRLFVSLGPYVGWDLCTTLSDAKDSKITGSSEANLKGYDIGLIIAGGFEYGPLQLSLNPQFGLVDISKNKTGIQHRAYKMALTYHFIVL